jgi:hypothetical protein
LQVVGAAHTRKLFEKSLTQNLQNEIIAPRGYIFGFAETCVRCAGQDDDPHSGSRGKLTRVKPGELSPVLRAENKLPYLLLGANKCKQG